MVTIEDFESAGAYPVGPVSAWPKERHEALMAANKAEEAVISGHDVKAATEVMDSNRGQRPTPRLREMAGGLLKTTKQALVNGKVKAEIRADRIAVCELCPSFNKSSRRCNECGCFMDAKTWVGGDPSQLCPLNKWEQ